MLGKTSMRILKHAIAVMRPRGGVFDIDVDDEVCRSMVGFLEYLPAPTRLSFPLGLRLLEYGPFLFREGFRTFSSMDGETAARYLHHWERAGSAPSLLYQGVRALVFVCFYQHPKILEAMEVDWQGRADERVKFRARILREQILRQASEAGAAALAAKSTDETPPAAPADETPPPAPRRASRRKAAAAAADPAPQPSSELAAGAADPEPLTAAEPADPDGKTSAGGAS